MTAGSRQRARNGCSRYGSATGPRPATATRSWRRRCRGVRVGGGRRSAARVQPLSSLAMTDSQYQTALALFGQGRHAEAVQLLGQATQAGHVPSMSLLGGQLLAGRGVAPDTVAGIRMIVGAAERGRGI